MQIAYHNSNNNNNNNKSSSNEIYKVVDKKIKNETSIENLLHLYNVIDFQNINRCNSKFKNKFTPFKINQTASSNANISQHPLPQINARTKAYIIDNDHDGRNGLIILPQVLTTMQQIYYSYHSLTSLCEPTTAKSNLNKNEFEPNLFKKFVENHIDDGNIINKKMLDLKWTTHGYHFNWDKRIYQEHNKNEFPTSLNELSKHIIKSTFVANNNNNDDDDDSINNKHYGIQDDDNNNSNVDFYPEASIVNFYSNKGRMGGHKDDVEPDQTSPVVSISLCNDAIFLIGGSNKHIEPIPIRLRSGDVMIMSGSSRRAVHGISTILQQTIEPHLLNGLIDYSISHIISKNNVNPSYQKSRNEERKEKLMDYFQILRININVRQVYDRSRKTIGLLNQRKTMIQQQQRILSLDLPIRNVPSTIADLSNSTKNRNMTSTSDLPVRNLTSNSSSLTTPPVVFLDIDGVLNYTRSNSEIHLEPELVQRFRKLHDATRFKIVLSTFWRGFKDYVEYILSRKGFPKDQIIGTTTLNGNHATNTASNPLRKRADDIMEYLAANPHIKSFVILDDRISASNSILAKHFVHTVSKEGLTDEKAKDALNILNNLTWNNTSTKL